LTPVAAINSCSVGSRDPGGILPLVMSLVRRATSSLAKDRGANSGWVTERLALLILLTLGGSQSSYDMTSASMGLPPRSTKFGPQAQSSAAQEDHHESPQRAPSRHQRARRARDRPRHSGLGAAKTRAQSHRCASARLSDRGSGLGDGEETRSRDR